ncbi:MAG TPA: hypothetical protein VJV79_28370 [Polyangiaceae bacterium]|nr:hypothetical protein [Polyangiaceae bacterium]
MIWLWTEAEGNHAALCDCGDHLGLLEWWTTLVVAGDTGTAFSERRVGCPVAQWDMFLALLGAVLPRLSVHARTIARVPYPSAECV